MLVMIETFMTLILNLLALTVFQQSFPVLSAGL